jgi:hypothetical protein
MRMSGNTLSMTLNVGFEGAALVSLVAFFFGRRSDSVCVKKMGERIRINLAKTRSLLRGHHYSISGFSRGFSPNVFGQNVTVVTSTILRHRPPVTVCGGLGAGAGGVW